METASRSEQHVRFKPFELNLHTRELYRHGLRLKLQGHPVEVLVMLLERPGELVTRDDLKKRLWPEDTFVDFEHGLNSAINRLRETLGDHAESPRFIETLHKLGYRFIAPIDDPEIELPIASSKPIDPPVIKPPPAEAAHTTTRKTLLWTTAATLGALAILLAVHLFSLRGRLLQQAWSAPSYKAIAVLPLQCLSPDPEQEYFADGMTDALITRLDTIKTLRVISRQSIMRYKGSTKPLPQIAHELNVDVIMEGTVKRSGDKVRITSQLLEGKTDRAIWSGTYERDFQDVLNLQSEVAEDIAREIRVTLSPAEFRRLSTPHAVNPGAYEAYLKGRFEWYKLSSQNLDDAEQYFQLALAEDPHYALAYAGLADVWMQRADSGFAPPAEARTKALAAALTALQIDKNLSEPHVSLANVDALCKRDWAAAEREFRIATDLNPNSADAHLMYADLLITLKRNDEWKHEIQQALALDPLSNFTRTFYAWHLIYLGRYDEAIVLLDKALVSQPGFASAYMGLWGAYHKKHMEPQALQRAVNFFNATNDHETAAALEVVYRKAGYRASMKNAADLLAMRARTSFLPNVRVARLYAHAGDSTQAIRWLQKAYAANETPIMHLSVSWDWDSLRSDPRFQDLISRMNYPQ